MAKRTPKTARHDPCYSCDGDGRLHVRSRKHPRRVFKILGALLCRHCAGTGENEVRPIDNLERLQLPELVAHLRHVCAAAPFRWPVKAGCLEVRDASGRIICGLASTWGRYQHEERNARAIAAALNALPVLISKLDELEPDE